MEIKSYESFVHDLLERTPRLKKAAQDSYENNPNQEHPIPPIRNIIEKLAHPEKKEHYLEIAKKYELGELSTYDNDEATGIILWLMDWNATLSHEYRIGYCYGRMEALKESYDHVFSNIGTKKDSIKFLAVDSVFSENDITEIIDNWDAIKQAWDDRVAENKRRLEEIDRHRAAIRECSNN